MVIRFRVVAATLLVFLSLAPGAAASGLSLSPTAIPPSMWNTWASVAWRYFQVCWNPSTGLTYDSCSWHYFSDWGLASNVLALVSAHELGLISTTEFDSRVDKVLSFVNNRQLITVSGHQVPYGQYNSDTTLPSVSEPTNSADYGRLLGALYVLKDHLIQLDDQTRAGEVDLAVGRVDNTYFGMGTDLYAYYASLGFTVWGFPSTNLPNPPPSDVQATFQSRVQNGPFVDPSLMYGVQGIPDRTRTDGEPFIDAILELGNFPQVTGLASWPNFLSLSRLVYDAQERRSATTGKPEFWTGGGLDFPPYFDSEWIVYDDGRTWVTLDNNGNPLIDIRLPVAYAKLMFAYNALYGTTHTENMLNTYASQLQATNGFKEGVHRDGIIDQNVQVQTNQIILAAAAYVIRHSSPTGTTTTSSYTETSSLSSSTTTSSYTTETATSRRTTETTTSSQTTQTTATSAVTFTTTIETTLTTQGSELRLQVLSNSTITNLVYDSRRRLLNFTVSGPQKTSGLTSVTIARGLLDGAPVVFVDGAAVDANLSEDPTYYYIRFSYPHSSQDVTIGGSNTIAEMPSALVAMVWILAMAVLISRASVRKGNSKIRL